MDIDRALKFTFVLHLELGRSCITPIIAANHIFLASCALGVRVRCRRHRRLSKNLPLSQSPPYLPFVHGSAPLSKATRARVSEAWRRGGLRKNSAGALLEKKCSSTLPGGRAQATVQFRNRIHPFDEGHPSFASLSFRGLVAFLDLAS